MQPMQPKMECQVPQVVVQAQPMQPVVVQQQQAPIIYHQTVDHEDASCIYVCAFLALFIAPVGWISLCVYNCGSGLGPNQSQAFKVLVVVVVLNTVWQIIWASSWF